MAWKRGTWNNLEKFPKVWNPKSGESWHYQLTPEQLNAIEEMSVFHCTEEEIAHALGVARKTFMEMKQRNEEILKRIALGQSKGKRALRSVQFKVALSGNVNMLMYLGKVLLGQVPDAQVHIGGNGNGDSGPSLTNLSPAAKEHLAELANAITRAAVSANATEVEATVTPVEEQKNGGNGNGNG